MNQTYSLRILLRGLTCTWANTWKKIKLTLLLMANGIKETNPKAVYKNADSTSIADIVKYGELL